MIFLTSLSRRSARKVETESESSVGELTFECSHLIDGVGAVLVDSPGWEMDYGYKRKERGIKHV